MKPINPMLIGLSVALVLQTATAQVRVMALQTEPTPEQRGLLDAPESEVDKLAKEQKFVVVREDKDT